MWTRAVWRPRPRGSLQRAVSRPSSALASASSVVRLPGAAVLRLDSRLPPPWRRVGLDCAWSACGLKFFSNWLRLGSPRGPDCPLELGPQGAEGGGGGCGLAAPAPPVLGPSPRVPHGSAALSCTLSCGARRAFAGTLLACRRAGGGEASGHRPLRAPSKRQPARPNVAHRSPESSGLMWPASPSYVWKTDHCSGRRRLFFREKEGSLPPAGRHDRSVPATSR